MVENLIENAVKYGESGGRVDVALAGSTAATAAGRVRARRARSRPRHRARAPAAPDRALLPGRRGRRAGRRAAPASASRSSSTSSTATAAASRSRASRARARPSGSSCPRRRPSAGRRLRRSGPLVTGLSCKCHRSWRTTAHSRPPRAGPRSLRPARRWNREMTDEASFPTPSRPAWPWLPRPVPRRSRPKSPAPARPSRSRSIRSGPRPTSKETGIGLNYQSIGSGGGIRQIKAKTVDFGATDAPLKGDDLEKAGLVQFPTVMGGVVPVVNIPGVEAGRAQAHRRRRSPTSTSARSRSGTIRASRRSTRA